MTADIQSRRRLGLTATLVREDGRADDVFSLIGPKRYDAPWRDIEAQGWIAPAACTEVRVTLTDEERMRYAVAEPEDAYRVGASARLEAAGRRRGAGPPPRTSRRWSSASSSTSSTTVAERLGRPAHHRQDAHPGARAALRRLPDRRDRHAGRVEGGELLDRPAGGHRRGADLGHASAAARRRPSGSVGCCGRRPTAAPAHFYTIVSRDTNDQEFAAKRQRFLAEQGYAYTILDAAEL